IGRSHVAGGTAYIAAVVAEPGLVKHTAMGRLIFGPLEPSQAETLEALREACKRGSFNAELSQRIMVDIWAKFASLTVFSGMTAITRCPIGPILEDPALFAMLQEALHESIAVARGRQIPLPHSMFNEVTTAHRSLPPTTKSSLLQDLERGRPLELPWLSGAVVRIGREV